ncbi:MAG: ATP-binding protein [Actinobacteria bacterium]|nr:MAG: ATP-binding protein [Actinomycetota bacterium]
MPSTIPQIELTLPARAENVAVVRHALGALGETLDIDTGTLSDIKLAITEACTNVVVHAYNGDEGPMEIEASIGPERKLTVVVRDEGRGIAPRPNSPGLGLGLPLIATLSETVALGSGEDDCTEVRMTFRLDASDGQRPRRDG